MIRAQQQDKPLVVNMLAKAFDHNRSVNYIIPQDKHRAARIKELMAYSFALCNRFGEVLLSDDRKACALLLHPEKKNFGLQTALWHVRFIFKCVGITRLKMILERESRIKRCYPNRPFTYLWFIGVAPEHQQKGSGSILLEEIVAAEKKRQRPVYLETSTPENLSWYQKRGFSVYNTLYFTYQLYMLRN